MNKRVLVLLAGLALCVLTACAEKEKTPVPPPDLTGDWTQSIDEDWYQIATISEDKIEIWWYLASTGHKDLYWSGTFTPPTDSTEPYTWESRNHYTQEELDATYHYHRTSREEVKTFTYQDGKLSYNVTSGHLRLGFVLKRASE